MTKAYKLTVLIADHDDIGAPGAISALEQARYPNHCIMPMVAHVETIDLGPWSDDHVANKGSNAFLALFPDEREALRAENAALKALLHEAILYAVDESGVVTYWRPEDEALLDAHERAVENRDDNMCELARSKIHDLLASLRAENAALKARNGLLEAVAVAGRGVVAGEQVQTVAEERDGEVYVVKEDVDNLRAALASLAKGGAE